MKNPVTAKTWPIVKKSKILRTLGVLSGLFLLASVIIALVSFSYRGKTEVNLEEARTNQQTLMDLNRLAKEDFKPSANGDLFLKKSFADYDEVVPFIAFLENLFHSIDNKGIVTVKSRDEQIFLDHYADYRINLKIREGKESDFYKAMEQLNQSRFIVQFLSFEINYKADEFVSDKRVKDAELILRLFLE